MPPEVKVRLSVEGTPEALAAFRSVQAQAQATGKASGKAFAPLSGALSGIKGLLAGAAAAFTVGALVSFGKEVIDNVEALGRMAVGLGTTVEHMSGLSVAATLADSDLETASGTVGKLAKSVDALKNGSPIATAAFARLGLAAKDFAGDDSIVWYETVARKLSQLADGGAKTAVAMALMGKNARAALPTMKQYIDLGGRQGAEAKALEMGVMVDAVTLSRVAALADAMKTLKMEATGVALQFMRGFAPSAVQTINALSGSADGAANSFRSLGDALGWVLRLIVPVVNLFETAGVNLARVTLRTLYSMSALGLAAQGRFKDAKAEMDRLKVAVQTMESESDARIAARNAAVKAPVKDVKTPDGRDRVQEERDAAAAARADAAAAARLARKKQAIEDELKLTLDGYKAQDAVAKRAYDGFDMGLDDYFARRRELVEKSLAAEIAALDKQRALADQEKDPAKRGSEQDRIATAARSAALAAEAELKAIESEESEASDKSLQAALAAQKKILEARGEVHAARMIEIAEETRAERDRLTRVGLKGPALEDGVAAFHAQAVAQADFEEQLRQAQETLSNLQDSTNVTPEQIAGLKAVADALREIAVAAGTAAVKAVDDLDKGITKLAAQPKQLSAMGSTLANAFGSWLGGAINQVNSLGDAFRSLAGTIAQAVQQALAMKFATWLIGGIPGLSEGGKVEKKASGGLVRGPGSSTSDSVFALLSNGEYVVRAYAAAQPGVMAQLEAINRGTPRSFSGPRRYSDGGVVSQAPFMTSRDYAIQQFADGGPVQSALAATAAARAGGQAGSQFGGSLTLNLPPGVSVGDAKAYIESPDGSRSIVKLISKNRRAIGSALR